MEEVDNIIIHFLRRLDIEIEDNIKQLSDFPVNMIISSVSRCISKINPDLKVPQTLPQGVSHRIEVAAQLASMCKDLGYKNEVGYQTFLYYNEADLRKVLMFLIEHLPTEDNVTRSHVLPSDRKSLLYRNISRKIGEELNTMWVPQSCNFGDKRMYGKDNSEIPENNISECDKLIKMLIKAKLSTNLTQIIAEPNTTALPTDTQEICAKVPELDTGKSLKDLREEVKVFRQTLSALENENNAHNMEFAKIQKSTILAENELKSVESILRSLNLNIEDNVGDILIGLRKLINSLHSKSEQLTSKNLSLKTEINKMKSNLPQSEKNDCKNTLLSLKETATLLKEEYAAKEELKEQLKKEFAKLSRGNKRTTYTKRILEIISNVDKQNLEINKILEDTRLLQKEINTLEGQLDRCFSVADETLFKDAKRDDQAKKAYKLLALLHSECNTIVGLVNDTGTLSRELVDLEDHVNSEKTKQTEDTLRRIQTDLSRLQEET